MPRFATLWLNYRTLRMPPASIGDRRFVVGLALALGACSVGPDGDVEIASASFAQTAAPLRLEGYVSWDFGQALTTRCVEDVWSAFWNLPGAPTGKVRYRSMGGRRLPPFNARLAEFRGWEPHVQSVARLSLPWQDNRFAVVSRSNPGHPGGAGVFLVYLGGVQGWDGTRWGWPGDNWTGDPPVERSTYLYYPIADTDHPGGMQAAGEFLVVASEGAEGYAPFVDFFQLRRVVDEATYEPLQRFTLYGDLGEPVAPSRFITAAALTALHDGRYLLFVLGKDEERQGWFYLSDRAGLSADTSWSFLGHVVVQSWYQNVSLVTECGSGTLYLVGTDNVDFDGGANSGTEYADLMQVTWDGERVDVPLIDGRTFAAGGGGYCTFRAAANVFVDRDGQLALYCHAYKANTDLFGEPDSKLKLAEYAP
jgi:hypothetical protein